MIVFNADDHSYRSLDDSNIDWISVTTLVSHFKKPFDAKKIAEKVTKSKKALTYFNLSKSLKMHGYGVYCPCCLFVVLRQ